MKLTGFPRFIPPEKYEHALARMADVLIRQPGVITVYQVGGIGTPGISDIDVCAVFEDGAHCGLNPLAHLDADGRYLFLHGQFGLSRSFFSASQRYGFFHAYRLLRGEDLQRREESLDDAALKLVQIQTGLEYLVKMYVWMMVSRTYGIVRMRNLMLLVKALVHDLVYVGASSGRLFELVNELIRFRQEWFRRQPDHGALAAWVGEFCEELPRQLSDILDTRKLFVPGWAGLSIARNMELVPAAKLGYSHRGIALPAALGALGRKYFNLQHRFNRFRFHMPIATSGIPAPLLARHELIAEMVAYNRAHLPYFAPVTYGLAIFDRKRAT